jgi:hypothetical protein
MAGLQSYEELEANLKEYTEQLQQVYQHKSNTTLCSAALCCRTPLRARVCPTTFSSSISTLVHL